MTVSLTKLKSDTSLEKDQLQGQLKLKDQELGQLQQSMRTADDQSSKQIKDLQQQAQEK